MNHQNIQTAYQIKDTQWVKNQFNPIKTGMAISIKTGMAISIKTGVAISIKTGMAIFIQIFFNYSIIKQTKLSFHGGTLNTDQA